MNRVGKYHLATNRVGKYYKRFLCDTKKEYIKIVEDINSSIYKCIVLMWEVVCERCVYSIGITSISSLYFDYNGFAETDEKEFLTVLGDAENMLNKIKNG